MFEETRIIFGDYNILFFALMFSIHYFLSTRTKVYWGAILPVLYTVYCGWIIVTNSITHYIGVTIFMLLGLFMLLAEWGTGRDTVKKKHENELKKM
ncbi:hypothetical protein [Priestia flexa]|nr:hypothetical protein OC195_13555 [Priestia flexa]